MAVYIPLAPCEDPAGTSQHARPSPSPSPPPPPYSLCNAFSPKASLPRRLFDVAPRNISKGDFLSVVRLLRELVDTFEECGRPSQEQIGLIAEIRKLEEAIIQVEAHYGNIESPAQQMVLEHAAQACQKSIYDFVTDARQCRRNVDPYCTEHTGRVDLTDMRLDLVTDKDMNAFRRCISDHVQSIQTLLITIQVSSTGLACGHEDIRPSTSPQAGQTSGMNYSLVLLNNSFATLRQALVDQGSVSQNTLANVDAIREIMVMNNLQLLSALEQLQKSIPAQVLLKEPVIFTDALDRVAPIHLDWITSWDAFLAVLEVRFSHLGSNKIKRREFALQESATRSELAFTRPIDLCLKPGQHVDMCMIFQDRTGVTAKNVCPHCHTVCEGPTDTETICVLCGCQFRRVKEQDDQSEAIRDAMSLEKIVGQAAPGRSKKRKRVIDSISLDEVGPSDFKKVRLMCSQRQHHTRRTESRLKREFYWLDLLRPSPSIFVGMTSRQSSSLDISDDRDPRAGKNSSYPASSLSVASILNSRDPESTHWSSNPGLPGEQPLSVEYFSRSARQYDNSVLSKIAAGPTPQQIPLSLSNTSHFEVPPPLAPPSFGNADEEMTDKEEIDPHKQELRRAADARARGEPAIYEEVFEDRGALEKSDLSYDAVMRSIQQGRLFLDNQNQSQSFSATPLNAGVTSPEAFLAQISSRVQSSEYVDIFERERLALPPWPPYSSPPDEHHDLGLWSPDPDRDLISPNWCGGVVDDTPPIFSLSDDLYGGPLDKLFNGDPSGSTMSPPIFDFKGEILRSERAAALWSGTMH